MILKRELPHQVAYNPNKLSSEKKQSVLSHPFNRAENEIFKVTYSDIPDHFQSILS